MSTTLTKKQQKALAFRSKQKAKRSGKEEVVPQDVPEQDPIEDDGADEVDQPVVAESSKKRKREEEAPGNKAGAKVKGKGKAKNAWDDEAEGEEGKIGKKSKKEIKQRFILFVGELIHLSWGCNAKVKVIWATRQRKRKYKLISPKRPVSRLFPELEHC